jgi:dihydrofolate reductase
MSIIGIMSCDVNGVIGVDNKIPWRYPEDLEFFNKTTYQQIMIMGRKTFESLPESILSNRFNIVFSRTIDLSSANTIFVRSMDDFLALKNLPQNKQCYMIGGGEIARLFLEANLIDEFLLTKFKKSYQGDTYLNLELLANYQTTIVKANDDFIIYRYNRLGE